MTPDEIVAALGLNPHTGEPYTAAMVRYHCRDPRGALYGSARLAGRAWQIPDDAARRFIAARIGPDAPGPTTERTNT